MNEFKKIFKKVDGFRVLKEYAASHVLMFSLSNVLMLGTNRKSLELVRMAVSNKIICRLRKQYRNYIKNFVSDWKEKVDLEHKHSNKVWVCWLQGIEQAPEIVKVCYDSLCTNLNDREIVLITEENYKEWVSFPEYIEKKIMSGAITKTHLSDLIRLELLENFGGTWIDATVFCSGTNIPAYIWNSDLFMYQIMKPGLDGHAARISSWFITSCTNNPIIVLTKNLLYEYWKHNKRLVDYFLIHDMIELSIEAFPEEWAKVIPVSSSIPHILLLRFGDKYDDNIWNEIVKMTSFHKLSYKFNEEQLRFMTNENSFFMKIIGRV